MDDIDDRNSVTFHNWIVLRNLSTKNSDTCDAYDDAGIHREIRNYYII